MKLLREVPVLGILRLLAASEGLMGVLREAGGLEDLDTRERNARVGGLGLKYFLAGSGERGPGPHTGIQVESS